MRRLFYLFFLISTFWATTRVDASPELIDRIVAVIDEEVVLWSELNYRLRFALEQRGYADYVHPEKLAGLRNEILDEMIDEHVLVLKAQKDSVQVDVTELEEALGEQYRMVKSSMSETEFTDMLKRSGFTERQLKSRYRKEIRHRLLFRQLRTEVAYRLHITRSDVDAFRQSHSDTLPAQISVSHVNIKVRPTEEVLSSKRTLIGEIHQRLKAGESFVDLARNYSEDPGTAQQGGDLGCFGTGELMPEFEETAFELKPGEISDPVLTRYGYHLIQLQEKREDVLCASHILVMARSTKADEERVRQELADLRRLALAGEDFSQLARLHSQNRQTAMRGGLWDIFPKDQIPPFLQPHLNGLGLGDICEPFILDDGGHILKINEDQSTLESLLREQRTAAAMKQLIDDHRLEIHIEKRLDEDFLRQPTDGTFGYIPEERGADQAAQ